MPIKKSIKKQQTITIAGAQSGDMSGNLTGDGFLVLDQSCVGIQAIATGSPNGTLRISFSVDGTNWDLDSSYDEAISSAGNRVWNFPNLGVPYVRVEYSFSSGTGTLTLVGHAK